MITTTTIVFKVSGSDRSELARFADWAEEEDDFADICKHEEEDQLVYSVAVHNVPGDGFPQITLTKMHAEFPSIDFVGSVASPIGLPFLFEIRDGSFRVYDFHHELSDLFFADRRLVGE